MNKNPAKNKHISSLFPSSYSRSLLKREIGRERGRGEREKNELEVIREGYGGGGSMRNYSQRTVGM